MLLRCVFSGTVYIVEADNTAASIQWAIQWYSHSWQSSLPYFGHCVIRKAYIVIPWPDKAVGNTFETE